MKELMNILVYVGNEFTIGADKQSRSFCIKAIDRNLSIEYQQQLECKLHEELMKKLLSESVFINDKGLASILEIVTITVHEFMREKNGRV
jgi:predicted house-cleaning noncanonical NTP pyrophosphatase (MazG superfamily)